MSPADTNYAQETVESPIFWLTQNYDISHYIAYTVFGDAYVGQNNWSLLYCPAAESFCGSFPGPGTFDD